MTVEDLRKTKIYLPCLKDRVKFKNKLRKLGIKWALWDYCDPVIHDNIPFIYIDEDLSLAVAYVEHFTSFCADRHKQIFLEDVLAIEEPEEECKFKPYDRVLVRDDDDVHDKDSSRWRPREFSWYDGDDDCGFIYECTDGFYYKQCIPHKGNEHLVNTTNNLQ